MTKLLSLNIYKIETMNINGQSYTFQAAKSEDAQEFKFFLINNDHSNKKTSCNVSKETAKNFEKETGESLVTLVTDIFKSYLKHIERT